MAKQRPFILYKSIYPVRRSRIRIPQNPYKPLIIEEHGRKTGRPQDAWWWIMHRRGIYQPELGVDPLEARAVPLYYIHGTLPERIVYRWLTEAHFKEGMDFDFQSSLLGGRLELGGIVADFLFRNEMLIIQVQGPTHDQHLRIAKDEEQKSILASMGYTVFDIYEQEIYDFFSFERKMRQLFNMYGSHGGDEGGGTSWAGTPSSEVLIGYGNPEYPVITEPRAPTPIYLPEVPPSQYDASETFALMDELIELVRESYGRHP